MTKGLVKSSNRKQNFLKNRNPEKKLSYKQYKILFKYLKIKSKKTYYTDFINSYKYNIRKRGMSSNKRVTDVSLSNFITVKNREIFDKMEIEERFNNYFVNIGFN